MTAEKDKQHRQVTDDDVTRMKSRIGVFIPVPEPYNRQASGDAIRHHAEGIGDLNPLYNSDEYARTTRWGELVASPYFCETTGISRVTRIPEEAKEAGRGALSGVHGWLSGDELEFYQPIHAGDVLEVVRFISQVEDKSSELAGRTVHYVRKSVWTNQRGQVAAIANTLFIAGGRQKKTGERKKYAEIIRASYSPDELARIESFYDNEQIRGAMPRYWEDVNVGDTIDAIVKGPLTVSDMVAFNLGRGTPYVKAHRRAYEYRKAHPNAYPLDDYGVPDAVERVHWDEGLANKTGNPMCYDYGAQRINWLCNLMTHWAGDDGFLRKIRVELRAFNYVGDTTWCEGKGGNQAVAAARLDADVTFIGRIGDDAFGGRLHDALRAAGVRVELRALPDTASGVAMVVVDDKGENTVVVSPGANSRLSPEDIWEHRDLIAGSSVAITQLETPLPTVLGFARMCREYGLDLLLNASPYHELPTELLRLCTHLVVNQEEASALTGVAVTDRSSARRALISAGSLGPQATVITLGNQGCVVLWDGKVVDVDAYRVPVVDSVGAGDTFMGALGAALAGGWRLDDAVRFAAAAGAVACRTLGAQQHDLTATNVRELMAGQGRSPRRSRSTG